MKDLTDKINKTRSQIVAATNAIKEEIKKFVLQYGVKDANGNQSVSIDYNIDQSVGVTIPSVIVDTCTVTGETGFEAVEEIIWNAGTEQIKLSTKSNETYLSWQAFEQVTDIYEFLLAIQETLKEDAPEIQVKDGRFSLVRE